MLINLSFETMIQKSKGSKVIDDVTNISGDFIITTKNQFIISCSKDYFMLMYYIFLER